MNFEFGEVLGCAWQISWKNKVLWGISVLPFLISFLVIPIWLFLVFGMDFDPGRMESLVEKPAFVIIVVIFYLVIFLGSMILQTMSRSSATLGIYRAETGVQPITFVDLLKDGIPYFWRMLGVSLLIGLAITAFFFAFFACAAILSAVTMGLAAICIQPLFLLMIPLMLLGMAVIEQAEAAVIVDETGVMDAVRRGYELVKANLGRYALITIIIYMGMNILISIVTLPLMVPMFFMVMRSMEASGDFRNIFGLQAVFMIVLLPIMAVIQGFCLTYLKSAMMVMYVRLTRSPGAKQPILQEVPA